MFIFTEKWITTRRIHQTKPSPSTFYSKTRIIQETFWIETALLVHVFQFRYSTKHKGVLKKLGYPEPRPLTLPWGIWAVKWSVCPLRSWTARKRLRSSLRLLLVSPGGSNGQPWGPKPPVWNWISLSKASSMIQTVKLSPSLCWFSQSHSYLVTEIMCLVFPEAYRPFSQSCLQITTRILWTATRQVFCFVLFLFLLHSCSLPGLWGMAIPLKVLL